MRVMWYGLGLAAAVAALVTIDRIGTSDDSSQISMLVLLLGAAVLGFVAPRRAWVAGLVLGSALAVAGMIYVAAWPGTTHPPAPGGIGGAATLFVLVVPAFIAAYLGAGVAWLWRRPR